MHVFARWQHQEMSVDLTGFKANIDGPINGPGCNFITGCPISYTKSHVGQSFEDWDLFQVGGIIFF